MSLVLIWLLWPSQRNLEWTKISLCSSQNQHPRRNRHPNWRRALFVGHHKNWKTTTNQLCSELDVPQDRYWFSFGFTLLFWHTYHRMLTMVDVMLYIFILLKKMNANNLNIECVWYICYQYRSSLLHCISKYQFCQNINSLRWKM